MGIGTPRRLSEMAHYTNGSLRADRQDERLDRIERRLDLTETG
jgi:hypothetical protein